MTSCGGRGRFVLLMKTVELQVPDDLANRAEAVASKRGLTVDELLRLSLDEKLARDAELEETVDAVLADNAELYRRLA